MPKVLVFLCLWLSARLLADVLVLPTSGCQDGQLDNDLNVVTAGIVHLYAVHDLFWGLQGTASVFALVSLAAFHAVTLEPALGGPCHAQIARLFLLSAVLCWSYQHRLVASSKGGHATAARTSGD